MPTRRRSACSNPRFDTLVPSTNGSNHPNTNPLTTERPAFLLHVPEFGEHEILMSTVDGASYLSVVEIAFKLGHPYKPYQGLNLEGLQNRKPLIRYGRGERI
jgi:hypothetical protein